MTIREALEALAEAHGGDLDPEVVVEAARPEDSPLHNSFTWDDSEAGRQWRLHQARQLIKAVVTYETTNSGAVVERRVFVSLTPDRRAGTGYRLLTNVLNDEEQRRQLLLDARGEMVGFRRKYQRLSELVAVFEAMARVETQLERAGVAEVTA